MTGRTLRRSRRHTSTNLWLILQNNFSLVVVALLALVVPLLPGPKPALPWDGASGVAFEVGGVLLLAAALWRADGPGMRRALAFARLGLTPWLLSLAAWGILSCLLAASGSAAQQGLLHLMAGLAVYATVAYRIRRDADYHLLLDALTAVTILLAVLGIGSFVVTGATTVGALNHRSFGALLVLLVPLVLAFSGAPSTPLRRQAAQAGAALGALALLLAHWNPAYRGALVALLVFGLLFWRLGLSLYQKAADSQRARSNRPRPRRSALKQRRAVLNAALYSITILCAGAVFLALTPTGGSLLRQARPALAAMKAVPAGLLRSMSKISSHALHSETPEGRQSAPAMLAMVQARPLLGWGIGSFALYQKKFTHQGEDFDVVRRKGPQPGDRSHNFYFQLATELGLPGIALWLGALALFFTTAVRSLLRTEASPLRRRVLIGCVAAVAGQAVDAYGDGSWQFGAVSLFLWLLLGLGMAAALNKGQEEKLENPRQGEAEGVKTGLSTHLRFAVVCIFCAVLLSQISRASH